MNCQHSRRYSQHITGSQSSFPAVHPGLDELDKLQRSCAVVHRTVSWRSVSALNTGEPGLVVLLAGNSEDLTSYCGPDEMMINSDVSIFIATIETEVYIFLKLSPQLLLSLPSVYCSGAVLLVFQQSCASDSCNIRLL